MARYLSCPAVSQICALMVLPSTCRLPGSATVLVLVPRHELRAQLSSAPAGEGVQHLDAARGELDADG